MGLPSPPRPLLMSASLALAPPAPTSRPQAHCIGADAPAPARWLQTRGHARRPGSRGTRGRGRARKAPASSRPPLAAASRGWRRPGPQPGRAERRRRLPFSNPEPSPGAARGPALKRAGNLVYRPRREADRAFVWKVSISGSGCNVFLVTLASGRPAGGGGSPGSRLLSEADRAGDFCAFVLIFGNISFFLSRSLPGMS
ncbi:atherin-like [Nomascus leucogenys]|uniref:atherin-like n=1 Tax=Nomascus leucogenys TaxID=61853 RepID=UPI00122D8381|nr:atherin-like [Nomascus leucogenys]